ISVHLSTYFVGLLLVSLLEMLIPASTRPPQLGIHILIQFCHIRYVTCSCKLYRFFYLFINFLFYIRTLLFCQDLLLKQQVFISNNRILLPPSLYFFICSVTFFVTFRMSVITICFCFDKKWPFSTF